MWKKVLWVGISFLLVGCSNTKALPAENFSDLPQKYEYQIAPVVFNYPANWRMVSEGQGGVPQLSPEEVKEEREYHEAVGETIILWTPTRMNKDGNPDPDVRILGTLYVGESLPALSEIRMLGTVHAYSQEEQKYLRYRTRIEMNFSDLPPELKMDQWITDDYMLKIGSDLISIWVSYKNEETYRKVSPEVEKMVTSFRLK